MLVFINILINYFKFLIGLDEGDRRSLEKFYRGSDPPCQLDPEDNRFVLKGQYQMSKHSPNQ